MTIREQLLAILRQTKNSTQGYSHAEIFEILARKVDMLELEEQQANRK